MRSFEPVMFPRAGFVCGVSLVPSSRSGIHLAQRRRIRMTCSKQTRRLDAGIPVYAERFPLFLMQRRHGWRSSGVEHEHRWTDLT